MVTFSWKGAGSWSRWSFRASGAGCALGMWWSSMPIEHRFWFPIFHDEVRHTTSKMAMSPIRSLSWMTRKVHCTTSGVPWFKKTYNSIAQSLHISVWLGNAHKYSRFHWISKSRESVYISMWGGRGLHNGHNDPFRPPIHLLQQYGTPSVVTM